MIKGMIQYNTKSRNQRRLIFIVSILFVFVLNISAQDRIGFACGYAGSKSESVTLIDSLVSNREYVEIKELLNSRDYGVKCLAIIVCEILDNKGTITLTDKELDEIKKMYSSKKKINICSGCTYYAEPTIEDILNETDFDGWGFNIKQIAKNRYNEIIEIDSIINFGLGDTTLRKVYFVAEQMPKLINGKPVESYFLSQSIATDSCCAFKAHIGFIVEPDSSITNKMVYVHAVNCKEQGLVYNGQEISAMQARIFEILKNMPAIIPGKIDNKNVAIKLSFPVHVDCFMR